MDATRRTLLMRVRNRDDLRAWKEFTGLYRSLLLRYARARGLSVSQAEDVTENCMATLADHIARSEYGPSHGSFKHWLGMLIRVHVQSVLRKHGQEPGRVTGSERQQPESEPDEEFERIWGDEHLRHCLEPLRIEIEFKTFEAFRRIAFDQWSVKRVCETYDLTPQYVDAMKSRLTQRLRRLMQSVLGE